MAQHSRRQHPARALVCCVVLWAGCAATRDGEPQLTDGTDVSECGGWILKGKWPGAEHFPAGRELARVIGRLVGRNGSLLDLGAGSGQYGYCFNHSECAKDLGVVWQGFDGALNAEEFTRNARASEVPELPVVKHANLAEPLALPAADWVMSLEVGEHMMPESTVQFIANLHRSNREGVVISWARASPTWQHGFHHVNNHDNDEIVCLFQRIGYEYDRFSSELGREAALNEGVNTWFWQSFMVFRNAKTHKAKDGFQQRPALTPQTGLEGSSVDELERETDRVVADAVDACLRFGRKHEVAGAYWRGRAWQGGDRVSLENARRYRMINLPASVQDEGGEGGGKGDWAGEEEGRLGGAGARQLCMLTFVDGCRRDSRLQGLVDDWDHAYDLLQVGQNETRCLERSQEYFDFCGNTPEQVVVASFVPSGAERAFPLDTQP